MKIMILTPYYPPHLGGVELYTQNVAKGLIRLGHNVVVVTSGDAQTVETSNGLTIYTLPYAMRLFSTPVDLRWIGWIRSIIRTERPDVINAHTPVPSMLEIAARVKGKIPLVATYHAASLFKGNSPLFNLLARLYGVIEKRTLRRAASIIAPSPYVTQQLTHRHPGAAVATVDNSLWMKESSSMTPHRQNELIFINSLNRSHAWKGLPHIIAAIQIYSAKYPTAEPLRLRVVGDGDLRPTYEAQARKLGVEHLVTFAGALYGKEKLTAISRSKLLITYPTTSNDAFPTVFLEAWSQRTGIVTSTIEPMPSSLTDGTDAILAPTANPEALADKLFETLHNPQLLKALGTTGYARLQKSHNWELNSQRTLDILAAAAQGTSPSPADTNSTIAQVVAYYPPHMGGMERVAQELAEGLLRNGHPVHVYTTNVGVSKQNQLDEPAISYLPAKEIAHVPVAPSLLFKLLTLPSNTIIHFHLAQAFFPEMVYLAAAIRRIPYVVHFHLDVMPSGRFGKLFLIYKKTIMAFVIKHATQVIALTEEQRQLVITKYNLPTCRVVTIPNGVAKDFFSNHARTFASPLQLLFVGRFSKQKQVQRLVRAMSLVKSDVTLHLVGDGEDRHEIESLISEHSLPNVVLHGPLHGAKLRQIYQASDIFVLPSDSEGMPLALLEAMAAGLPVIGSDVVGIRELISKSGILVSQPSPATFAQAIDDLAQDQAKLRRLSAFSLATAKQYRWDVVLNQFEQVYAAINTKRHQP